MKNLKEVLLEGRMKTKFPEWYKDCKVAYDGQLYFKAWFYAELLNRNIKSKEEVNKLMKDDYSILMVSLVLMQNLQKIFLM